MRKQIIGLFLLTAVSLSLSAEAPKEKRNLLMNYCTEAQLGSWLLPANDWVPYPDYNDRAGWDKIPLSLRQKYIELGKRYLDYPWPVVKATEYLEFSRSGNRQVMEGPQGSRMAVLRTLALAELMEGEGRFLDDLINGVFSFCEQTYWGLSACFYMHQRGKTRWDGLLGETNLPDIEDPIIDLWVGESANDLAWIWYFFHEAFDRVSPVISRRLEREMQNRVLDPYYTRNDYWWITGWGRDEANNWNPWCNHNIMTAILLMEKDPVKKAQGVYKSMKSVDLFFNIYPDDGGCEEGPSYWNAAGGRAFDYLDLLCRATGDKIDLFGQPIVKSIGQYIYRAYISQGVHFINFADGPGKMTPRSALIYRYGERIADPVMSDFGAYLMHRHGFGENVMVSTLGLVLDDLFMDGNWKNTPGAEPLIGEHWFPELEVALARQQAGTNDGFYFAAKGGNNGETHNHNDVGSGIVFYNGQPVFVDAGVGTYTKETFEAGRYKIWTMQSDYHNLPRINGVSQNPGKPYSAQDSAFDSGDGYARFSTDIAGAYPPEAEVEKWVRSYRLDRRGKVTFTDRYTLKAVTGNTELRFVTPLTCSTATRGTVELAGDGFTLKLTYDPSLVTPRIETKTIEDPKITRVWGDRIYVLAFDAAPRKNGNIVLELTPKN